jgi:hypothetical protein
MTGRAKQALLFAGASLLTLPFTAVLIVLVTVVFLPATPPIPLALAAVLFYGVAIIPHPIGITLLLIATVFVWQALRVSESRTFTYPLVFYALVLVAAGIFDAWWHVTGQRFEGL